MQYKTRISAKTLEDGKDSPVKTQKKDPDDFIDSPFARIFYLRRTIGNQAVQSLYKSASIQQKLTVGTPNDIYEQEADRVDEQVMRMPDHDPREKPELLCTEGTSRRVGKSIQTNTLLTPLTGTTPVAEGTIRRVVWEPLKTMNENKRPFPDRWDIVGTDSLNPEDIKIWKPNKGDTYWCHGYTFGGSIASGGPFSTYGQEVQEKILANDGWKETRSCYARPDDILVFYNYAKQVSHSGIIREAKLKLRSERFCNDPMLRLVIDNLLILRKGLRGTQINEAVMRIQEALLDLGYELPIYKADGLFGDETRNAVCDYQMDRSLSYDGTVGPETLTSLDSEPQFLKSGLIDESKSSLESKWGYGPHNTSSWLRNAGYGRYICHSKSPQTDPPGAKGDSER